MSDSTGTATGPGGPGDDPRPDADGPSAAPGRSGSARLEGDDLLPADAQHADGQFGDAQFADGQFADGQFADVQHAEAAPFDDVDDDEDDEDLDAADAVPAGALAGAGAAAGARTASRTRSPETVTEEPRQGRIRNIGTFYRQVVAELRKVIWPTRHELLTYTSVVLVFVLVMVAIVAAFDFAFGRAVLEVFGDS